MNILGIVGNLGSGKDTVANILVEKYGFQRVSMADPFKRFARRVFSFSDEQLWGPSHFRNGIDKRYGKYATVGPCAPDSLSWVNASGELHQYGREWIRLVLAPTSLPLGEVDKGGAGSGSSFEDQVETAFEALVEWFHWLGTHYAGNLSPRVVLQSLGSEWGRAKVHQDIWVNYAIASTQYQIVDGGAIGVVVSDVRLLNELMAIKNANGKLIRLYRPDTDAESTKVGMQSHESETQQATFSDELFDFLVHNDGSLKDLEDAVHVYATCLGLAEVT